MSRVNCPDSSSTCSPAADPAFPAYQFWRNFVLRASTSDDLALAKWDMVLAVCISVIPVFLLTLKSVSVYRKASVAIFCVVFSLVSVMILRTLTLVNLKKDFAEILRLEARDFLSLEVWAAAAKCALTSSLLLSGGAICLGSFNKYTSKKSTVVTLVVVIAGLLLKILCFLFVGSLAAHYQHIQLPKTLDAYDFAFGVVPDFFNHTHLPQIFNFLFYTMVFLAEMSTNVVLSEGILSSIEDLAPKMRQFRMATSAIFVFVVFILAIPMTGNQGRTLHRMFLTYSELYPSGGITICWVSSSKCTLKNVKRYFPFQLFYLLYYGGGRISMDLYKFLGVSVKPRTIFFSLFYLLLLTICLVIVAVMGEKQANLPNWAHHLGRALLSFILIQVNIILKHFYIVFT